MESMRAHFERETGLDSDWTSYNPSLGRPLLNSARVVARAMGETKPQTATEPEPEVAAAAAANTSPKS
jgi:hypothetical protein